MNTTKFNNMNENEKNEYLKYNSDLKSLDSLFNIYDDNDDSDELTDAEFISCFKGRHLLGVTDDDLINKQISQLKSKTSLSYEEEDKLIKCYSEIKKTKDGKRKPKTCWEFVKYGKCFHCNFNNNNYGIILGNKWHPENEELNYLRRKKNF
jgi:hypothetical protein